MATVRELITKIGFNLDDKPLLRAQKGIAQFKSSVMGLGLEMVAITGALIHLVKHSSEFAEELHLNAQRLGLSTDSYQKLKYAAGQAGVSQEKFSVSLGFLSRNFVKAQQGGKAAVKVFEKVGISPTQLKSIKSLDDLMPRVFDGFNKVNGKIQQTGVAMELFGRGGKDAIPWLLRGKQWTEELGVSLDRMGGVLGEQDIELGVKFTQNMKTVTTLMEVMKARIGLALVPAVNKVIVGFLEWMKVSKNQHDLQTSLTGVVTALANAFSIIWKVLGLVTGAFELFSKAVGGSQTAMELLLGVFAAWKLTTLISSVFTLGKGFFAMAAGLKSVDFWMLVLQAEPLIAFFGAIAGGIYLGVKLYEVMIGRHNSLSKWIEKTFGSNALKTFRADLHAINHVMDQIMDGLFHPIDQMMWAVNWLLEKFNSPIVQKLLNYVAPSGSAGDSGAANGGKPPSLDELRGISFGGIAKSLFGNQQNTQTVTVNVNGAASPQDTADQVVGQIKDQLDKLMRSTKRSTEAVQH